MKSRWKKFLIGDKISQEFTLVLLIAFCSLWLGAMLFILEQVKNLLIAVSGVSAEKIVLSAPLASLKMNAMVLWDIALITILVAYLLGLVTVFYYTKRRMTKGEGEK